MREKQFAFTLLVLFAALMSLSLSQCKKSCMAGSGGDVTLVLKPQHHAKPIFSTAAYPDSAFIKFNATDFPGTNPASYDLRLTGQAGTDFINATGLKCGQYYIYMTGFDTTLNQRVAGGIPYNFSQTSGATTVFVPITEK